MGLLVPILLVACENGPRRSTPKSVRPKSVPRPAPAASQSILESAAPERPRWSPKPETLEEISKVQSAAWHAWPQSLPPQRLAFFAHNIAALVGDAVWAMPLQSERGPNPCRPNRLDVESPREITTLADQTLLVLGAKTTINLDSNCQTTLKLPKVSYLPGSRLLPDPRWPRSFALFDAQSGNVSRYRWDESPKDPTGFLLPLFNVDAPNVKNAACSLVRDGSLACVNGRRLFVGWPGHPSRLLGEIAAGAPVARLLPADRIDHVRVLRSDSELEEYWLVPNLPKVQGFALPRVAFDVAAGGGYLAVVQMETDATGSTEARLVLLEPDGTLRWSRSLERIAANLDERQRLHDYFECRGLASHSTRPLVAVSNCTCIDLFDAKSGRFLQRIDRTAP